MTEEDIRNKFFSLIEILKSMQSEIRVLNEEVAALRSELDKKTSCKSPESRSSGSDSDRSSGSVVQIVKESPVANWRKVLERKNADSKSKSKKKKSFTTTTPKQRRQIAAALSKYSIGPEDI